MQPLNPSADPDFVVRIVDDDPSFLLSLRLVLEQEGFICRTWSRASTFLEEESGEKPGVILLDIHMPEMTGLEVLQRLGERHSDLPVICMSGHSDPNLLIQSIESGAAVFLAKPFGVKALLAAIDRTKEKRRGTNEEEKREE